MRNIRPPGRFRRSPEQLQQLADQVESVLRSKLGDAPDWESGDAYDTAIEIMAVSGHEAADAVEALWVRYGQSGWPSFVDASVTMTDALFVFYDAAPYRRSILAGL